jgi:hypothetical protein
MIRNHDNQIKRSARSTRATPSSIETPACGYDWTENGVRELASEITQKTGRAIKFLFNKNTGQGDHQSIESNIFIAPTALLQERNDYPIYGAFAKTSFTQKLTYPYCLGEYQGALKKIIEEKEEQDEQEKAEKSCLYTFNLGHGFELSAEHEGSWTRMINSASSEETANIYYERVNDKIYCYLKHPIQAGEQFLGYYGDAYQYDNKRFLQSCDNWQTSLERYQTHIALYRYTIRGVERYALPDIKKLTRDTVNLPILIRLNATRMDMSFLPQWQQENKTLLHWACETGDLELLKSVRDLNPDISIQSRISGQTSLHAVMINQALSSVQKIEFLDVLLANQPVRQLIAIVLQDKEEQSILHLAIEQEDIELIAYILTTELQKRNYKDGKDIRNCLNKQGRDFILMALASGSLNVLDVIKAYMGAEDVAEILENREEVLREIWTDLATRYDDAVLRQIKLFLGSFVDPNDQEMGQKLNACLPVDESTSKMEECSTHENEVDTLCPSSSKKKRIYPSGLLHETTRNRQKIIVGEVPAGHSMFNRRTSVRPGRDTPSLVKALSVYYTAVVKIDCSWMPHLSDKILQYIHVGRVVKLDPELQLEMIFRVVSALPLGTMLLLEKNLSHEQLLMAVQACSENTVIILDPLLSIEQLETVASNLNSEALLALRPCMSKKSMEIVAVNLRDRASVTFYDSLFIPSCQIKSLSRSIKSCCVIETQPDMHKDILSFLSKSTCKLRVSRRHRHTSPCIFRSAHVEFQVSNAASPVILSFKYDAHVNLCASWPDEDIIHMVRSTSLGFVVSLDPALSLDMIRQVASELPFGVMLLLDHELSHEQLQAAAQSCSAGGVIILDPLLSLPQLTALASNMNTQSLLALRPCMSKKSMGTIAFYLKKGARLTFYDSDRIQLSVIEHTLKHLTPRCVVEVQPNMPSEVLFWISKSLSKQHRLSLHEPISCSLNTRLKSCRGTMLMLSTMQIKASLSGLQGTLLYPRYAKAWQHYAMIDGLPEGNVVQLHRAMDLVWIGVVTSNIKANTLVVLSHTITDEQFMAAARGAVVAREGSNAAEFWPVLLEHELEFRIGHPDGALSMNALERLERITEQEIASNACSMQFR